MNKIQGQLKRNSKLFIKEYAFENDLYEMPAICLECNMLVTSHFLYVCLFFVCDVVIDCPNGTTVCFWFPSVDDK